MLKKLLFKIAKGSFMGSIVGKVFQHCSWALPVKKVYSSKEIIAFYHPRPSYENHIIISPKRVVKNLQQMASDGFSKYFVKIWETAKGICVMHPGYKDSFVVVANGGKRQEIHFVIKPVSASRMAGNEEYKDTHFRSVLHSIDLLNDEFDIVEGGYSLVYQCNKQKSDKECPVFHIVSGKKLK